jgi:hypothetical protein
MADTPFRVLLAVLIVATAVLTAFYVIRSQIGLQTTPRYDVAGGDPEAGREALAAYGCGACHQIRGVARARGRAAH